MNSDSCASPLLSNRPVIVQSPFGMGMVPPTFTSFSRCRLARPAIISLSPRLNIRPSTSLTSGRSGKAPGPTPRTTMNESVLPSFGISIEARSSADAIGTPSTPFLIPGMPRIVMALSRLNPPPLSVFALRPMTIARSGRPLRVMDSMNPRDIASTDTSTATTVAMPTTITSDVA